MRVMQDGIDGVNAFLFVSTVYEVPPIQVRESLTPFSNV